MNKIDELVKRVANESRHLVVEVNNEGDGELFMSKLLNEYTNSNVVISIMVGIVDNKERFKVIKEGNGKSVVADVIYMNRVEDIDTEKARGQQLIVISANVSDKVKLEKVVYSLKEEKKESDGLLSIDGVLKDIKRAVVTEKEEEKLRKIVSETVKSIEESKGVSCIENMRELYEKLKMTGEEAEKKNAGESRSSFENELLNNVRRKSIKIVIDGGKRVELYESNTCADIEKIGRQVPSKYTDCIVDALLRAISDTGANQILPGLSKEVYDTVIKDGISVNQLVTVVCKHMERTGSDLIAYVANRLLSLVDESIKLSVKTVQDAE